MIAATMLGLPYVQYLRGHVNVDLIPLALPMRLRKALFFVTMSTAIVIICVMAFYSL
jgi:TRAP-type C4-dicarboxylate transport system permease small subunit